MGVERAEAQPKGEGEWPQESWEPGSGQDQPYFESVEVEEQNRAWWPLLLAGFLILAALAWLGAVGFALASSLPGAAPSEWVGWIAMASAPLILIGLVWLLFGRSARFETERFTAAIADMRRESQSLEAVLAIVASRIEENRSKVSDEAARLMSLGDEASDRLGQVTHYLARESAELERRASVLDQAAGSARLDIGILMADLPKVDEQARTAAESLRTAGLAANEQAAALESQLSALSLQGRNVDEAVGGAAQRLSAHISRIEAGAGAATERMDQAAAQMNNAIDGAMMRAAHSVDQARSGLDLQGKAMLTMIEQGRIAFQGAGAEAAQQLSERLDQIGRSLDSLAARISEQDSSSAEWLGRLSNLVTEVGSQVDSLGHDGNEHEARLSQALSALRELTAQLRNEIGQGDDAAGRMIDRTHQIAESTSLLAQQLRGEVAAAFAEVSAQADRTGEKAQSVIPSMENVQAAAALASESMTVSEQSLDRQKQALDALLTGLNEGVGDAEAKLRTLGGAISETDVQAGRLTKETGPELIEALIRVREAANQAANHAREAIGAAIPESVAALVTASREAIGSAITEPVKGEIDEIGAAAQRAVNVARQASERLTRQLLAIGEAAASIEARIEEDRSAREEKEAENLTRRVSLLIEAINSTSVDLNKVLSNEIADSAWAAYLKGDRGVFTRRAVRLLESGEAREVLRQYEREPDFRDQVNRYVHDFETMLRRVLGDRDGMTMGVTLLSSDMGKLYAALAQAIERHRN